jgi:hypothetical protein
VRIKDNGVGAVWIVGSSEHNFLFFDSLNANVRFLAPGYRDHYTYKQTEVRLWIQAS